MNTHQNYPQALLLLGCPEVPVQTSLAMYTSHLLKERGFFVTIAANNATLELIRTADPQGYYFHETVDLDTSIGYIADRTIQPALCYVFIHNDAGVSYLATADALTGGKAVGIIFGPEPRELVRQCSEAGLNCIWGRAVHNPMPLKSKIRAEVERWSA